jgi:hypothetical protein
VSKKRVVAINILDGTTVVGKWVSAKDGFVIVKDPIEIRRRMNDPDQMQFTRHTVLDSRKGALASFNMESIKSFYEVDQDIREIYFQIVKSYLSEKSELQITGTETRRTTVGKAPTRPKVDMDKIREKTRVDLENLRSTVIRLGEDPEEDK